MPRGKSKSPFIPKHLPMPDEHLTTMEPPEEKRAMQAIINRERGVWAGTPTKLQDESPPARISAQPKQEEDKFANEEEEQ